MGRACDEPSKIKNRSLRAIWGFLCGAKVVKGRPVVYLLGGAGDPDTLHALSILVNKTKASTADVTCARLQSLANCGRGLRSFPNGPVFGKSIER